MFFLNNTKSNTTGNHHVYEVVQDKEVLISLKSNSKLNEFASETVSIISDCTISNSSNQFGVKAVGVTRLGTGGNDTLEGTSRDDTLIGLGGNDILKGFGGNDNISGDEGRDRIYGGTGTDRLTGGSDPDFFYFDVNDIKDNMMSDITDFTQSIPGGIFQPAVEGDTIRIVGGIGTGIFSRDQFSYNFFTSELDFFPDPSNPATQFKVAFFANRPNFDVVTQLEIV